MAFTTKDLSVFAYANGTTIWGYRTPDPMGNPVSGVLGPGYFNGAADMLRVGDMILTSADENDTPAGGILFVTSNAGRIVTVSPLALTAPSPAALPVAAE